VDLQYTDYPVKIQYFSNKITREYDISGERSPFLGQAVSLSAVARRTGRIVLEPYRQAVCGPPAGNL
jgi:hypothetical protein